MFLLPLFFVAAWVFAVERPHCSVDPLQLLNACTAPYGSVPAPVARGVPALSVQALRDPSAALRAPLWGAW